MHPSSFQPRGRSLSFALTALLSLLVPALLFGQPAPPPGDRAKAEAQYNLTVKQLTDDPNHDLNAAFRGFQKAHELDPSYDMPLYWMGQIAFKHEDWAGAIKYFEAYEILDPTSERYKKLTEKGGLLEEAYTYQKMDATPEGKVERKEITELAKLEQFDAQIADALKKYLPTSQHVSQLKQAREQCLQQAGPKLLERLDVRQAELDALLKEMLPTAPEAVAKQAQVDRLRVACGSLLAARLGVTAKQNADSKEVGPNDTAPERRIAEIGNDIRRLKLEKAMVLAEMRQGLFCPGCGRTRSQILENDPHEVFPHAGWEPRVASAEELNITAETFDKRLASLKMELDALRQKPDEKP